MAEQSDQDRLRSYLAAQSAKLSAPEIRDRLQEAADEFLATVGGIPEATARMAPAPGEWSVAHIVDHVTRTLAEVAEIMQKLVGGVRPERPMTIGAEPLNAGLRLADLIHRLRGSQVAVSELLSAQSHEPHLDLQVPDHDFGEINWKAYALILRLHYKDHTQQVRKTLEALGGS